MLMKTIYQLMPLILLLVACQAFNNENKKEISSVYSEPFRPQFHFSPEEQWMNDPNGMVYYEGEYHLFYQYYPDSNVWGPMHWGHAVSKDMIHWEHLPFALYPDSLGYIFSGSAVIDYNNTTGFGSKDEPAMVAIYSYHDPIGESAGRIDYQTQGVAYSIDKGRTWNKYAGNPVLPNPGINDFRDPKVIWNEELQKWQMIIAVKDHISIYSSEDLKSWEHISDFGSDIGAHGGVWECPDLFPLNDGHGNLKWVMLVSINPGGPNGGSATQYFVGDFDGHTFTPDDTVTRWMDYGTDNYAGVTWSNIPENDGRRLLIGWMNNWQYANVVPTTEWRGAMTLPRELVLDGKILKSVPVKEIESLRDEPFSFDINKETWKLPGALLELNFDVDPEEGPFQLVLSNDLDEEVIIGLTEEQLSIDRTNAGISNFEAGFAQKHYAPLHEEVNRVTIYLDKASLEVFINDGTVVMTEIIFPNKPYDKLSFIGNKEGLSAINGYTLKSIWAVDDDNISTSVDDIE